MRARSHSRKDHIVAHLESRVEFAREGLVWPTVDEGIQVKGRLSDRFGERSTHTKRKTGLSGQETGQQHSYCMWARILGHQWMGLDNTNLRIIHVRGLRQTAGQKTEWLLFSRKGAKPKCHTVGRATNVSETNPCIQGI